MDKKDLITLLQKLLQREYLQRDLYETYSYYLFGTDSPAIQQHLKIHQAEEQIHIETLQRYLMGLGAKPLTSRLSIPGIEPLTLQAILEVNHEMEADTVREYSEAIEAMEGNSQYTSIRVDMEDILKQEQEHSHDLIQWLGRWNDGSQKT